MAGYERPWKGISYLVLEQAGFEFVGDLVALPYRQPDGTVHNRRIIAPSGRCWWEATGLEVIPFGLETLPPESEAREWALLLTEGESDALATREHFAGVTADSPVRGWCVLGMPGAGTWRPAWRRWLAPFPLVYLLGDGDEAGRNLNARVKRDAPWARSLWLPEGEDVRSILQKHGAAALDPLFARADEDARLWASFMLAPDVETWERLLLGAEVPDGA